MQPHPLDQVLSAAVSVSQGQSQVLETEFVFLQGTGLPTPTQEVEVIEYEVEHGLLLEKRGIRGRDREGDITQCLGSPSFPNKHEAGY